jgi:hypothetical protein
MGFALSFYQGRDATPEDVVATAQIFAAYLEEEAGGA